MRGLDSVPRREGEGIGPDVYGDGFSWPKERHIQRTDRDLPRGQRLLFKTRTDVFQTVPFCTTRTFSEDTHDQVLITEE